LTTLLLAGAGAVAVRAGRQLADTPGVDRLLVTARHAARGAELATALGGEATPFGTIPPDVDGVTLAIPGSGAVRLAQQAVDLGIPVASVSDDADGITSLLALDAPARAHGSTVVVCCGMVPGLADVLARHAANVLEPADEVHVARFGTAGEACAATLRRARRERPVEWRDGAARTVRHVGPELVWFPDPVGAQECITVAAGVELLHAAVPGVTRATVRAAEPPPPRRRSLLARRRAATPWGAARVEVWGWRDGARTAVVYGVIEQPAVAAGTVLAVAGARVAGLLPDVLLRAHEPGARGLGELVEPAPFLAELARRGVKAAVFEGVASA
jgi:hypothetical protein